MSKREFLEEMRRLQKEYRNDIEVLHLKLDDLLLAYIGDAEITKIFKSFTLFYS